MLVLNSNNTLNLPTIVQIFRLFNTDDQSKYITLSFFKHFYYIIIFDLRRFRPTEGDKHRRISTWSTSNWGRPFLILRFPYFLGNLLSTSCLLMFIKVSDWKQKKSLMYVRTLLYKNLFMLVSETDFPYWTMSSTLRATLFFSLPEIFLL